MKKSKRVLALEARRDTLNAELGRLDDAVIERGAELDETEQATYDAHSAELEQVNGDLRTIIQREQQIDESRRLGNELGGAANRNDGKQGDDDDAIYRADDFTGPGPLMDIFRAQAAQDPEAIERVRKHNDFMAKKINLLRASDRADFGGLLVPEYATSDYVLMPRGGRAFLDSLNSRPLTRGTIIIGRQTVKARAASPAAENIAYITTDVANEPLTLTAKTIAGVVEVSVEAVEFNQLEEPVLFADLTEAYNEEFDRQAFWGSGAAGEHLGLFTGAQGFTELDGAGVTTYRETYAMLVQGAAAIHTSLKKPATHAVMSSARFFSLAGATDSQGRPLLALNGSAPSNVAGQVPNLTDPTQGLVIAGLRIVVDDAILEADGDDTRVVVYRAPEFVLREQQNGRPTTIRVDAAKAAQGTVQFIARGFSIYSAARRPGAVVIFENLPEPTFPLEPTES